MRNVPPTIDEVLALARLITRLADNLAGATVPADLSVVIPVITEGQWDAAIPTRRAELYGDDERGVFGMERTKKTTNKGIIE